MSIQNLLRDFIAQLDGIEHTTGNPSNSLDSVDAGLVPAIASNADHSDGERMVPPLQANLELLKKATGVESVYDEEHDCGCQGSCECDGEDYETEEDQLGDITRLAGIPAVAVIQSASPNPF